MKNKTFVQHLSQLLLVSASITVGIGAHAEECKRGNIIAFADGETGCVSDYAFAKEKPFGYLTPIGYMTASAGVYSSVALPTPGNGVCPAVVGYEGVRITNMTTTDARRAAVVYNALRHCSNALNDKLTSSSVCSCATVLTDGSSKLTKAAFEALTISATNESKTASDGLDNNKPQANDVAQPANAPSAEKACAADAQNPAASAASRVRCTQPFAPSTLPASKPTAGIALPMHARALVIGNSAYSHYAKLNNPRQDANAVAAKLRSFGLPVDLVLDANRNTMVSALMAFQKKAKDTDVNIIYYAGHNMLLNGTSYLIPVDMQADNATPAYVKLNGISLNDAIDGLPGKSRLVFMEACRNNPVSRSAKPQNQGVAAFAPPASLISSAAKDCTTVEEKGRNSYYTAALLEHLNTPQDIAVLLRKVRQSVLAQTNNSQEPWEISSLPGDELVLSQAFKDLPRR